MVVLLALVAVVPLFPNHVPPAIYGLGVVSGASLAIQALGVVLVYRSNRVINFAQVQVGVVAATFFASLVQYQPLLRGLVTVCPVCGASPALREVNYWLSAVLALAGAAVVGYAIHLLVIKRFGHTPRLVVTVATIFLAQLLGGLAGLLPTWLSTDSQRLQGASLGPARLPFSWNLTWGPARFGAPQILMTLAALGAVVGLTAYFRLTGSGVAMRAAADDPARAQAVGIDVDRLRGRTWATAGALSGTAAIIAATAAAPPGQATLDLHAMVAILAVAVIARLSSLPLAAAAAAAIGVLSTGVVWSYGSSVILETVLLAVILVVLLVPSQAAPWRTHEDPGGWQLARDARPVPSELRGLAVVKAGRWAAAALITMALLGYPWLVPLRETNLGALVLIYAVVVVSLLVLTGWAGQISLGQFGFAAVGAYVAAAVRAPFPVALALGALGGAVVATLVGLPALGLRRLELAITSLAFAATVPAILLSRTYLGRVLPDALTRPAGLGLDFRDERSFYYLSLIVAALALLSVVGLRRSRFGRALIAGRDNEPASRCFGINVTRLRLSAFAVSGALAGLAGAMFAFHQRGVTPTAFDPGVSVTLFVTAVIGGLGTVVGPVLGSVYLAGLTLGAASPLVTFMLTGVGGLLVVLVLPGGLAGLATRARDSALRGLALRRDIAIPSLVRRPGSSTLARAPIAPRSRANRETSWFGARYRPDGQWATRGADDTVLRPVGEGDKQ